MVSRRGKNKSQHKNLTLYLTSQSFVDLEKIAVESIVGKEENAGNQHILLSLQCFQAFQKRIPSFE